MGTVRHGRVKVLALIIAAILPALPAAADEVTGTLKRIKDSGVFTIGYREASRPFSFVDEANQPAGFSIDLCMRIATAVKERLGLPALEVSYVPVTAENRLDKVADGTIDIECGNTTATLGRQEQVDFTNTIFITGASLMVRADDSIGGLADLAGKTISVVAGTTTEQVMEQRLAGALVSATVVKLKDHNEAIKALADKKTDAHAADQLILIGLQMAAPDRTAFALVPELYSYEPYGLAVRRNDADFRLVANRALAQLYRSGEIAGVYNRWFGEWGGRPAPLLLAMFALNSVPE